MDLLTLVKKNTHLTDWNCALLAIKTIPKYKKYENNIELLRRNIAKLRRQHNIKKDPKAPDLIPIFEKFLKKYAGESMFSIAKRIVTIPAVKYSIHTIHLKLLYYKDYGKLWC